ncbi:glycoside hydrolase family 20 zincin-like fold domain-containing protein [Streptomyces sp. M10(2022)]
MSRTGSDAVVTGRVIVVADDRTDAAALDRLVEELKAHGAPGGCGGTRPRAPSRRRPAHRATRARHPLGHRRQARRHDRPDHAEGYALRVSAGKPGSTIALGGTDATGQFYAVQTLGQLFVRAGKGWKVTGAQAADFPRCRCAAPSRASTGSRGPTPNGWTRWTSTVT